MLKTKNEKQNKTGQGSGFQNGQRKYEPGTQHLIVEEFYATLCAEDEEDKVHYRFCLMVRAVDLYLTEREYKLHDTK